MADKKITALTALDSTGKDPTDLLHIIDFSASPVNKKITLANLFARIDTPVSSVGVSNFEYGPTTAISAFKIDIPNATPAASAETTVVINENANQFVDFRVETNNSAQAIFVDSSDDSGNGNVNYVKINGDSAAVDFQVYSDTGILVHTDAPNHSVGIGKNDPSASYMLDVAADVTTGASAGLAGWLGFTSTPDDLTGGATGSKTAIPVTTPIAHLTATNTTSAGHFSLADGTQGQIKILVAKAISSSQAATVTPTNYGGSGDTTILFNADGESVTLLFTNGRWNAIGYGKGVDAS
jgi:hypothetical protein